MSVPNQTPYNIYTANGLTTVFAYQFMIMTAGDIEVSINGTPQTSGYTVQGAGQTGGGQVEFITPPANGSVVMLLRNLTIKRDTEYQDNGDLLAETINADFDRLWLAMQQAFLSDSLSLKRPLLGGPYNAGNLKIIDLKDPTDKQDAATKGWVDLQYSIPTSEAKQAAAEAKEARDESREIADKFGDVDAAVTGAENARNEAQQAATAANEDALRAISAADKAESIVDVSGTYPDIPTGLAATPDGKYFRVPLGSSSDTAFIYYLNASGTALDVAKIPGLELVNKILNNFAGVKFLRGYGSDAFEIIGIDFHILDYGSDRMKSAGADIKYGYGTPGKPFSILGIDNQMASFLTSDSLQDAGVTILRGYASSPFAVLGADNQLLLMGSGGSSASSALPETGLLDYLIAMQERAYTGGYLVILCGPGDSLSAGTGGLGAIDAMYSLFAAQLGHGGIGYFAPSNDNTASRDLLNMELVYSGWVDNQTYGKKCGPLNFALVPWTGRTNLFFRVKDASRSNPIYQHDVVEVGFTGTGDAGTSSQFRFRATDRNDDGSIGPAGSGEWQTATVANNPEGSETITIVRVEGLGPGTGRYSLEIEPPASGQAGYPAIVSFNCINSAGGVRVIRYARGGATAAYHLNQTASYQTYWMRYFSPDLVFINLGENDYALTDAEFMAGYSAIVERVQDALPDVPVFLERWYSDNHIKRDAVYDAIQTKYGMLGFNVRDLIRNSNFAFQNGYAYSTTNPADPHPNARGARIIGAYQAKRALLNYAVQSLRK